MSKPVQVALTFDFDAYSTWIGSHNATSPSMLSRGEFGPVGVRRILPLLDRYGAKATFFAPATPPSPSPRPSAPSPKPATRSATMVGCTRTRCC